MRFIVRRMGLFLVTLWAALTLNFLIPRLMPGNEATAVLSHMRGVSPQAMRALEVEFGVGINENPLVLYAEYLRNCLTGDFGLTAARVPVMNVIMQGLPWTLALVGVTTVVAFVLGTGLG